MGWESGDRFHARNVLLDPYAKYIAPHVPGQGQIVLHLFLILMTFFTPVGHRYIQTVVSSKF